MPATKPVEYVREARAELAKVVWPSREETVKLTGLVIGISLAVGLYIGGIDYILSQLLKILVR